jgi:hypothetical protein
MARGTNNQPTASSIGHGYELGWRATSYESVRKARKKYACEACVIESDTGGADNQASPGTGSIMFIGQADDCTTDMHPGDLYVALDFVGEHAEDFGGTFRYTFRTCLPCALHFQTVVLSEVS